jgi:hypothetical protein
MDQMNFGEGGRLIAKSKANDAILRNHVIGAGGVDAISCTRNMQPRLRRPDPRIAITASGPIGWKRQGMEL